MKDHFITESGSTIIQQLRNIIHVNSGQKLPFPAILKITPPSE